MTTFSRRARSAAVVLAGLLSLLVGGPAQAQLPSSPSARATRTATRVVALGDIACDPASWGYQGGRGTPTVCRQRAVGRLVASLHPDALVTTGDNQYEEGRLRAYRTSYDAALGALRGRTWPVPGNHDYLTPDAGGYRSYFGSRGVSHGHTWRAFQPAPGWRILLLDSDCWAIGGCGPGSPEHRWLVRDLRTAPSCTVAVWHHPFLTAGEYKGNPDVRAVAQPLWSTATRGGVDIVLNGHDHNYQRFAPRHGLREFVVGTGGRSHYAVTTARGLRRAVDDRFGALVLSLRSDHTYAWSFRSVSGRRMDHGSSRCTNRG